MKKILPLTVFIVLFLFNTVKGDQSFCNFSIFDQSDEFSIFVKNENENNINTENKTVKKPTVNSRACSDNETLLDRFVRNVNDKYEKRFKAFQIKKR